MEHQYNCHTSTDTDDSYHGAGEDRSKSHNNQEAPPRIGITHSISPGVPCPETMLVAIMSNGSYLIVGYPQGGPTALALRDDADPLRQALEAAFGRSTDEAANNGNENNRRTEALPEGVRLLPVRSDVPRWLGGTPGD